MHKTTLYLPEHTLQRLQQEAQRSGRSQSELIREALDAFLAECPRAMPRSFGMGHDPDLAAADLDDWLRENWRPA